jgi:hypothetical protein
LWSAVQLADQFFDAVHEPGDRKNDRAGAEDHCTGQNGAPATLQFDRAPAADAPHEAQNGQQGAEPANSPLQHVTAPRYSATLPAESLLDNENRTFLCHPMHEKAKILFEDAQVAAR